MPVLSFKVDPHSAQRIRATPVRPSPPFPLSAQGGARRGREEAPPKSSPTESSGIRASHNAAGTGRLVTDEEIRAASPISREILLDINTLIAWSIPIHRIMQIFSLGQEAGRANLWTCAQTELGFLRVWQVFGYSLSQATDALALLKESRRWFRRVAPSPRLPAWASTAAKIRTLPHAGRAWKTRNATRDV